MKHKISKEFENIINYVIEQKLRKKIPSQCKEFNAEKMAGYVENTLSDKERRDYEKHLFNCDFCLGIYKNIQKEIELMYKEKYYPVMDELLNKAFKRLDLEEKSDSSRRLVLRLIKKGIEIIKMEQILNFQAEPVLLTRGNNKENLLKRIKVQTEYKNIIIYIDISFLNKESVLMDVEFSDSVKGDFLYIKSENKEVISIKLQKKLTINNIEKGKYKLYIDKDFIIEIEIN